MENPTTQPINADVINLLKTQGKKEKAPDYEQAKDRLRKIILSVKIDPQRIIQAGKYAQAALDNPKMYPIAIQTAIRDQLISPQDVKQNGIDFALLGQGITAAKMAQELVQEGKV